MDGDRQPRRDWHGLKRHVKHLLSLRLPHALLRAVVRLVPSLRRGGRLPAPARLGEVSGEAGGAPFVMLHPDRCIIAKELYWGGGGRPAPEDQFAIEVFAHAARRADVVVDIGAYTGLFTIVAARSNPAVEVHAFEIVPENFRALLENCVRNDVLDRVTLHHEGVGAPGKRIRVPIGSGGSALPDFHSAETSAQDGVRVRLTSLDALGERLPAGAQVAMKIDVEGTEADVLRHGQRFLARVRPLILCEVLPEADGGALEELLRPHGYRFSVVREQSLAPISGIVPDPVYRDWLFAPTDPNAAPVPPAPRRAPALTG